MEQADNQKPDLIVIGTKGATGDRNVLFGSITTAIIGKSHVPVLAIPPSSVLDHFENITFATDFQEGDLEALELMIEIAELYDSTVEVVHIAEKRTLKSEIKYRGFRDLVTEHFTYPKITFDIEYEYDFYPGIVDYLIDHRTSIVALVRYEKSFWKSLAERNHSKEMAFYTKIPLLVLVGNQ